MLNIKKLYTKILTRLANFKAVSSIDQHYANGQVGYRVNMENGHSLFLFVGKLDASTNYVQFIVDGVDKGYIKFSVSRNV